MGKETAIKLFNPRFPSDTISRHINVLLREPITAPVSNFRRQIKRNILFFIFRTQLLRVKANLSDRIVFFFFIVYGRRRVGSRWIRFLQFPFLLVLCFLPLHPAYLEAVFVVRFFADYLQLCTAFFFFSKVDCFC